MTDLEGRGESLRTTLAHIFYGFGPDDFELDEGSILNDAMKVIEAFVDEEKRKLSVLHTAQESILMQEITSLKAQLKGEK